MRDSDSPRAAETTCRFTLLILTSKAEQEFRLTNILIPKPWKGTARQCLHWSEWGTNPTNVWRTGCPEPHIQTNPKNVWRTGCPEPHIQTNPTNVWRTGCPEPHIQTNSKNVWRTGCPEPHIQTNPTNVWRTGCPEPHIQTNPTNVWSTGCPEPHIQTVTFKEDFQANEGEHFTSVKGSLWQFLWNPRHKKQLTHFRNFEICIVLSGLTLCNRFWSYPLEVRRSIPIRLTN
jgi:hypothetical protein